MHLLQQMQKKKKNEGLVVPTVSERTAGSKSHFLHKFYINLYIYIYKYISCPEIDWYLVQCVLRFVTLVSWDRLQALLEPLVKPVGIEN